LNTPPRAAASGCLLAGAAPLPIRLLLGAALAAAGLPILSTAAGRARAVHLLAGLGLPWATGLGWVLGLVLLAAGLGLLLGAWTRLAAALGALSIGGGALLAALAGGLPQPPAGERGLPGYELSAMAVAVLAALVLGGGGVLSVDRRRAARRALRMKGTTLMAEILPGREEPLRRVLEAIEADPRGNPYVRLGEDRLTHFARWVILPPARQGGAPRLLYAATHNGDRDGYYLEMARVSPGLDAIWGNCPGYPGRDRFLEFARGRYRRTLEPFYAFPYETVESLRAEIAIRRSIEAFLELGDVARYLERPGLAPLLDQLAALARPPSLWRRLGRCLGSVVRLIFGAVHQLLLRLALWLAQQYTYLGTERTISPVAPPPGTPEQRRREIEHELALEGFDNRFVQNQLTLYVTVIPRYLWRLRLAQFAGTFINRYGYPPGEIGGIFTIHAFHWVVIDGGRHGIFMSNYDGSMENYIGDFVDKLVWSLDAFFNNTVGYPPGGMRQVEWFSPWLLRNQLLCQVYYSAYPQETVLRILRDRQIADTLGQRFDLRRTEAWLAQL
jgi:uncharacterized membrane protein YphA (DoxX/SURF4 family)